VLLGKLQIIVGLHGSCLLGILNANREICKHTDTDVAFTREYSRVSIFHRNVSVLIKIQDRPRITI